MITLLLDLLATLSALGHIAHGFIYPATPARKCTPPFVKSLRASPTIVPDVSEEDINDITDDGGRTTPEGRVPNIDQWLTWSDESLSRLSTDGKGGLYDRINDMLGQSRSSSDEQTAQSQCEYITTPRQIHESARFAVLSHGNQTDPIYNYVNAAGFEVFRWPEDVYYRMPSRYSAPEGSNRQARAAVIDTTVAKDVTYIDEAIRVRYPNETVTLREAILWNVYDDDGNRVGQTVLFDLTLCSYSDERK